MSAVGLGQLPRQEQDPGITRRFVIPRVDEFEDNYVGQWLQVNGTAEPHDEVADNCEFADWEAGESTAYDALLLDRRSESPVSVALTAYGDGQVDEMEESTVFVINDARSCGDEWIGLAGETVPQRAVVGEEPGPTVEESDGGTSLGGLLALVAVGVGMAVRLLWSEEQE